VALQAGFVGCGNITDTHARAAREAGLGIAAFFGRDPRKAEAEALVAEEEAAGPTPPPIGG
jgi:predicted dehydrogenase